MKQVDEVTGSRGYEWTSLRVHEFTSWSLLVECET